jgi:hypothetical protein
MKRPALVALLLLSLSAPALAQTFTLTVDGRDIRTGMTSSTLPITPVNPDNVAATTTNSVGLANASALNTRFASGWSGDRLPMSLAGQRIPLAATWVISTKGGFRLNTGGMGDFAPLIESEYSGSGTGGPVTGVVWVNRTDVASPVISCRSFGTDFGHFRIDGNFGNTSRNALVADTSHRAAVGLEVQGQQSGVGCGKISADSLTIANCVTGLKVVATPAEANGDESEVKTLRTPYCDTGVWLANSDAVSWKFRYYDMTQCLTGVRMERGYDLEVTTATMQINTACAFKLDGDTSHSGGSVIVGNVLVDAQAPSTCYVADIGAPSPNYNAQIVNVGFLRGQVARAANAAYFRIDRSYGELNVYGGIWLVEGSVDLKDTRPSTHPYTVRFRDCRFKVGSNLNNIRKLFTTASRGYVNVLFEGNREEHGSTGQVNAGKLYTPFSGLIYINSDSGYVVQ